MAGYALKVEILRADAWYRSGYTFLPTDLLSSVCDTVQSLIWPWQGGPLVML